MFSKSEMCLPQAKSVSSPEKLILYFTKCVIMHLAHKFLNATNDWYLTALSDKNQVLLPPCATAKQLPFFLTPSSGDTGWYSRKLKPSKKLKTDVLALIHKTQSSLMD